MNVFEAVKENVTTRQAAELYGIRVRRNGMVCCPFHADRTPSMKVDRRFHCFGCGADGDVIDFVSRLFGLPCRKAAVRLADDFGICYDSRRKRSTRPHVREPTPEQNQQKEETHCYRVLTGYLHLLLSCPRTAGGSMEPAVCGSPAKKGLYRISAGYSAVWFFGGTQSPCCRTEKRGDEA